MIHSFMTLHNFLPWADLALSFLLFPFVFLVLKFLSSLMSPYCSHVLCHSQHSSVETHLCLFKSPHLRGNCPVFSVNIRKYYIAIRYYLLCFEQNFFHLLILFLLPGRHLLLSLSVFRFLCHSSITC